MRRSCLALILACSSSCWAASAHEHGVARLDVAVEGTRLTLQLETPLENLLGFERAPRTDAERQRVQAMLQRLRAPGGLFRADAAAACKPGPVSIEAPVLGLGQAGPAADAHADLDASFEFTCARAPQQLDVLLFDAFAPLQRIQLQLALPGGQAQRSLRRPSQRVQLAP
jgi:hypothetical protein